MFVVTGGGSGIGRALAQALAKRGKDVFIIGRRQEALAETARFSPLITYLAADVSTQEGRERIAAHLQPLKKLKALVHNAGVIEPIIPVAAMSEVSWQQFINTNLNASLFLSQLLLPKLQQGRILSIGSGAAYFPVAGWSGYCVSKAALSMLMRCWQLENPQLAFSSVMPGIIDTDMQALIRKAVSMDEEKRHFFLTLHKEGRLLAAETVASFLCWLLLEVDKEQFVAKEWDIYDSSHHQSWLAAAQQIPHWE